MAEPGNYKLLFTQRDYKSRLMGAAGWHICFDVLDHLLKTRNWSPDFLGVGLQSHPAAYQMVMDIDWGSA
jgi:hypothetical protein